jgi:Holliday junction resolvase RusA-like endonuclease
MTFMVNFVVCGEPVAKGRPRFARQKGFVKTYTPKKTVDWEQEIAKSARQAMGSQDPLDTPIALSVRVYKTIPVSWSKAKRQQAESGDLRPVNKPDIDNYIKAVMDAGNGILWLDDSQVCELHSIKVYGSPRIEVTAMELLP